MRHPSRIGLLLVVGFLSILAAEPVDAGRVHPELDAVLRQAQPGDLHDVIVELVPQVDPDAVAALAPQDRVSRRAAIVSALQALASQTQAGIITVLSNEQGGQVKHFRPLWILNGVGVRATTVMVRMLAARHDVWEVRLDRHIPPPAPVPTGEIGTATAS